MSAGIFLSVVFIIPGADEAGSSQALALLEDDRGGEVGQLDEKSITERDGPYVVLENSHQPNTRGCQ
jgi:hypothetical protein